MPDERDRAPEADSSLAGRIIARLGHANRMLSPWMQRYLADDSRPEGDLGVTGEQVVPGSAIRTQALIGRVSRTPSRMPGVALERYAGGLLERFERVTPKYEPEGTALDDPQSRPLVFASPFSAQPTSVVQAAPAEPEPEVPAVVPETVDVSESIDESIDISANEGADKEPEWLKKAPTFASLVEAVRRATTPQSESSVSPSAPPQSLEAPKAQPVEGISGPVSPSPDKRKFRPVSRVEELPAGGQPSRDLLPPGSAELRRVRVGEPRTVQTMREPGPDVVDTGSEASSAGSPLPAPVSASPSGENLRASEPGVARSSSSKPAGGVQRSALERTGGPGPAAQRQTPVPSQPASRVSEALSPSNAADTAIQRLPSAEPSGESRPAPAIQDAVRAQPVQPAWPAAAAENLPGGQPDERVAAPAPQQAGQPTVRRQPEAPAERLAMPAPHSAKHSEQAAPEPGEAPRALPGGPVGAASVAGGQARPSPTTQPIAGREPAAAVDTGSAASSSAALGSPGVQRRAEARPEPDAGAGEAGPRAVLAEGRLAVSEEPAVPATRDAAGDRAEGAAPQVARRVTEAHAAGGKPGGTAPEAAASQGPALPERPGGHEPEQARLQRTPEPPEPRQDLAAPSVPDRGTSGPAAPTAAGSGSHLPARPSAPERGASEPAANSVPSPGMSGPSSTGRGPSTPSQGEPGVSLTLASVQRTPAMGEAPVETPPLVSPRLPAGRSDDAPDGGLELPAAGPAEAGAGKGLSNATPGISAAAPGLRRMLVTPSPAGGDVPVSHTPSAPPGASGEAQHSTGTSALTSGATVPAPAGAGSRPASGGEELAGGTPSSGMTSAVPEVTAAATRLGGGSLQRVSAKPEAGVVTPGGSEVPSLEAGTVAPQAAEPDAASGAPVSSLPVHPEERPGAERPGTRPAIEPAGAGERLTGERPAVPRQMAPSERPGAGPAPDGAVQAERIAPDVGPAADRPAQPPARGGELAGTGRADRPGAAEATIRRSPGGEPQAESRPAGEAAAPVRPGEASRGAAATDDLAGGRAADRFVEPEGAGAPTVRRQSSPPADLPGHEVAGRRQPAPSAADALADMSPVGPGAGPGTAPRAIPEGPVEARPASATGARAAGGMPAQPLPPQDAPPPAAAGSTAIPGVAADRPGLQRRFEVQPEPDATAGDFAAQENRMVGAEGTRPIVEPDAPGGEPERGAIDAARPDAPASPECPVGRAPERTRLQRDFEAPPAREPEAHSVPDLGTGMPAVPSVPDFESSERAVRPTPDLGQRLRNAPVAPGLGRGEGAEAHAGPGAEETCQRWSAGTPEPSVQANRAPAQSLGEPATAQPRPAPTEPAASQDAPREASAAQTAAPAQLIDPLAQGPVRRAPESTEPVPAVRRMPVAPSPADVDGPVSYKPAAASAPVEVHVPAARAPEPEAAAYPAGAGEGSAGAPSHLTAQGLPGLAAATRPEGGPAGPPLEGQAAEPGAASGAPVSSLPVQPEGRPGTDQPAGAAERLTGDRPAVQRQVAPPERLGAGPEPGGAAQAERIAPDFGRAADRPAQPSVRGGEPAGTGREDRLEATEASPRRLPTGEAAAPMRPVAANRAAVATDDLAGGRATDRFVEPEGAGAPTVRRQPSQPGHEVAAQPAETEQQADDRSQPAWRPFASTAEGADQRADQPLEPETGAQRQDMPSVQAPGEARPVVQPQREPDRQAPSSPDGEPGEHEVCLRAAPPRSDPGSQAPEPVGALPGSGAPQGAQRGEASQGRGLDLGSERPVPATGAEPVGTAVQRQMDDALPVVPPADRVPSAPGGSLADRLTARYLAPETSRPGYPSRLLPAPMVGEPEAPGPDSVGPKPTGTPPLPPSLPLVERAGAAEPAATSAGDVSGGGTTKATSAQATTDTTVQRTLADFPADLPLAAPPVAPSPAVIQRYPAGGTSGQSSSAVASASEGAASLATVKAAEPQAPKPDLDDLARKIYPILKRMLTAEMERRARW